MHWLSSLRAIAIAGSLLAVGCGESGSVDAGREPDASQTDGGQTDAGPCAPACDGTMCGDDGCGGTCTCADALVCGAGVCLDPSESITSTTRMENTGPGGEVSVTVTVESGRSFLVTATTTTADARLSVLGISDPSGSRVVRWQDWYNETRGLTNAFFASDPTTVINWPVRDEDPPLVPRDYVVRLGSYQLDEVTPRFDIPLEVTTHVSHDMDLERGTVRVALIWADGLGADTELVAATEAAIEHWREVWADVGMALELRTVQSTLDPALPNPRPATAAFAREASALTEDGEIALVVGDRVGGTLETYGIAGQIPGPLIESGLSVVVVGWLANAGVDGVFSDDDIRLYGEVFAHEVGHYLGLLHPVSSDWDYWDALADTPECAREAACEAELGTNLMFPSSICDAGVCVSTTEITDDQRGVMQRYTGTL